MTGKALTGLLMLIFGVLGVVASIAILVFVTSHSPYTQWWVVPEGHWVFKTELYPFFLIFGWGALFVSALLTLGGVILMAVGGRRVATSPMFPPTQIPGR
jgi:hypothetical protein